MTREDELRNQLAETIASIKALREEIDEMQMNGISDIGYFNDICDELNRQETEILIPILDSLEEYKNEKS